MNDQKQSCCGDDLAVCRCGNQMAAGCACAEDCSCDQACGCGDRCDCPVEE
jgi:hypothetical protein